MLKLLIFDLDGTLADTSQDITDAINYAMQPFGTRKYSVEETKAMVGSGISKLLESLVPKNNILPPGTSTGNSGSASAKEIATGRFLSFYSDHLMDHTKAYPFVNETLEKLGAYTKTVLSNKREAYSREILERLNMSQYFDAVWGSDSVREKKPSPAAVLDFISRFRVSRSETAIIGDSNFDVEAGKAAGVNIIGVSYGFRSRESLNGADIIIDGFDELVDVLPKLG